VGILPSPTAWTGVWSVGDFYSFNIKFTFTLCSIVRSIFTSGQSWRHTVMYRANHSTNTECSLTRLSMLRLLTFQVTALSVRPARN
jgi:hypothetical protein